MLARPMRGVLVVLVLLAAAALGLYAFFAFHDPIVPPPNGEPGAPTAAAPAPFAPLPAKPADSGLGANLVATRIAPPSVANTNLADAPTAWLRVIDRNTQQPIAGAPIRRLQGGGEIAFTDERGLAAVALRDPEQLVVIVDDYLLRLAPTRLGTTEAEPQDVQLVRDEWSIVRRLQFTTTNGAPVPEVFVRFRPKASTKNAPSPVPAGDAVAQRAWGEHAMLASRPVCADVPVQLGSWDEDRVHRLANGTDVRFLTAAEFTLEAATTSGLVARQDVRIDATPRTGAGTIRVAMTAGVFLAGAVVDGVNAQPIAGAKITRQGGEPLGLVATTASNGAFRFGPLWPEPATLLVRSGDHEPLAFGPVQAPASGVRIALRPLPAATLRGRVRARPTLRPLANATVAWHTAGAPAVTATTDAEGTFTLRAAGGTDARLTVSAPGYLAYAELVSPGSPFADYDLLPTETAVRLVHGLTAQLEGIVVDAEGRPVAGADVRWQPRQRPAPTAMPGRRVLEGAVLDLALGTRTGADGTFRLETNAFGAGTLSLAGDAPGHGLEVTATAGRTTNGLRLQR
jgi:hypothetical protein